MKAKKFIALLLAVLMVVALFSACASSEKPADDGQKDVSPDTPDDSKDSETDNGEEYDIAEIEFWLGILGTMTDNDPVDEAINAITEKEIGVHVNVTRIAAADFNSQLMLAVSNGEQIDVAAYRPNSFLNFYSSGCLKDITDEVAEYGQDLTNLFGDLLNSTTINGKLYGFPSYRQLNSNYYIIMRTDALEDLGLVEAANSMKSWADFEAILEAFQNSEYAMHPVGKTGSMTHQGALFCGTNLSDLYTFDALGDNVYCIITDDDGNVGNLIESTQFQEQVKMYARWMAEGYVYPDGPYDTEAYQTGMAKGAYMSTLATCEYGVEVNWKQSTGLDLTCPQLALGSVTTASAQKFGTFVPASCQDSEAAVKFLNLMYTNADLMNILIYGVEGKHYVVNDEGVAVFPDGKDATAVGYHAMDFTMGNQFLVLPWDGSDSDFRDKALEDFQNAPISPYLGLTVDLKDYDNLVAGLSAVYDEYYNMITNGYYTDELYQEYVQKLQIANVDEYIGLFQTAVSDFLA